MSDIISQDGKLRCRGCNGDLMQEKADLVVRVSRVQLHGVDDGLVDFTEAAADEEAWGYMHRRCFLLAVGDPKAITMMG